MEKKERVTRGRGFGEFWRLLRGVPGYGDSEREELKRALVREWSGGRTESLTELRRRWPEAYERMVAGLRGMSCVGDRRRELELWRRRVIAAVCGYVDRCGYRFADGGKKVEYAKGVACRATGCAAFNGIAVERLRALYAMFRKMGSVDVRREASLALPVVLN